MREPQRLANGVSTGYGLGLMRGRYRGVEIIHHAGNALGGNAQMLKVPDAGLDVVVMSNRQDVQSMSLVNDILDAVLPGLEPIEPPAGGGVATGVFRSPGTGRVIQLFGKEGAQIVSIGGIDVPFGADGAGGLRPLAVFSYIRQCVELSGDPLRPESIVFTDFGTRDELLRVGPGKTADAGKIVGRYSCQSVQVEATITESGAGPRLRTVGRFGSTTYALAPLAEGIWRTKPARLEFLGGLVAFEPEYDMFRFSNYQTRPLLFRRTA
jgi:D-aminopeptidase